MHIEEREVMEQISGSFAVRTHYMRNIISARYCGTFAMPIVEREAPSVGLHRSRSSGVFGSEFSLNSTSTRHSTGVMQRTAGSAGIVELLEHAHVHFMPRGAGGIFCAWLTAGDLE